MYEQFFMKEGGEGCSNWEISSGKMDFSNQPEERVCFFCPPSIAELVIIKSIGEFSVINKSA